MTHDSTFVARQQVCTIFSKVNLTNNILEAVNRPHTSVEPIYELYAIRGSQRHFIKWRHRVLLTPYGSYSSSNTVIKIRNGFHSANLSRINPKIQQIPPITVLRNPTKFHENRTSLAGFLLLFAFLVSSIHHYHPALLHRHTHSGPIVGLSRGVFHSRVKTFFFSIKSFPP